MTIIAGVTASEDLLTLMCPHAKSNLKEKYKLTSLDSNSDMIWMMNTIAVDIVEDDVCRVF